MGFQALTSRAIHVHALPRTAWVARQYMLKLSEQLGFFAFLLRLRAQGIHCADRQNRF